MTIKAIRSLFIPILAITLLHSCASSIPRSELQNLRSLIEIIDIDMEDGDTHIRISHRNNRTKINNKLSCQLALKDFKPIKFEQIPLPDLTNYAVETIDLQIPSADLPKVSRTIKQLPYVLDCYLISENFRNEHLIQKAILYKVPGSKGEYR